MSLFSLTDASFFPCCLYFDFVVILFLQERLKSAHGKEKHSGVSAGKKRQRKLRVDDLDGIKKIKAVEDLHEQEILRSISSSGSKSELMASPCAVESNDLADAHDGLSGQFNS